MAIEAQIRANHVNTAMQGCLAKAISLHGIGLYIYAGEDLPLADQPIAKDNPIIHITEAIMDQIKLGHIKSAHEQCKSLN